MKNEMCVNCDLRNNLCEVGERLGPAVVEAGRTRDAAGAIYSSALETEFMANTQADIAVADARAHVDGLDADSSEEDRFLAGEKVDEADAAIIGRINAIQTSWAALSDFAEADSGLAEGALGRVEANVAVLGQVCIRGPKNGKCRAPRPYRKSAEHDLEYAQHALLKPTGE